MGYVIHVDNSDFFRKLMKTFLVEHGLECKSFSRGNDVVQAVNAGEASYVITGLELADMSGEELVKRLVAASCSVPIITLSSNEEEEQTKRLAALGVKATILKSGNWKEELDQLLR
jgi:two-component system cell cycle response regulator